MRCPTKLFAGRKTCQNRITLHNAMKFDNGKCHSRPCPFSGHKATEKNTAVLIMSIRTRHNKQEIHQRTQQDSFSMYDLRQCEQGSEQWADWVTYRKTSNISATLVCNKKNCRSLRCSWSITCRHCSNYIFILDSTHCFNGLGKDNCNEIWETFKFWDLVWLILVVLRYM